MSCSYDCSIRFHRFDGEDWITQEKIENAHESTVWSADFSGDGNYLVTVGADFMINVSFFPKNCWEYSNSVS